MKATIQKLACLCLGLLLVSIGLAQSNYQAYWVHEDHVIPAKLQEYEQVSKEFVEACNKNNIKDLSFITMATDDFRYAYIGGIENMASLDKNSFAEMQEKMGAEAFGNMMSRMDKCYTDHVDYVLKGVRGVGDGNGGRHDFRDGQPGAAKTGMAGIAQGCGFDGR